MRHAPSPWTCSDVATVVADARAIALIIGADAIHRILTHRALTRWLRAAQPPPIAPARPLPEMAVPF